MRYTKEEKEVLFDLLDHMTDRWQNVDKFDTPEFRDILYTMFKKLRLELKGF